MVSITFSETPLNFNAADDLDVVGGSLSSGSFDGSGLIWNATFTADDDFSGTGSVTLEANSYTDASGNLGSGDSDSVSIDTTNPTASVDITQSSLTDNNNTSVVKITFSEAPVGFNPANDLDVVGGSLSSGAFDGTGLVWTATFTANDGFTGTGSVTLEDNSYKNASLNRGMGSSDSVSIDTAEPVVTVDSLTTGDPSPALSGTIDDPEASISVRVNTQFRTAVNHGDGTWSLADNSLNPLSVNSYDVYVSASDQVGNIGVDNTTNELRITVPAPVVTVNSLITNDSSPALSGTVNDAQTLVAIKVSGQTIFATNLGDGTWSLADNALLPLAEGIYDVEVRGTNIEGVERQDTTTNELVVDTTAPTIGVDEKKTQDATPSLSGTINDPTATITVTVNGNTLAATNNGNGTWQVEDNRLPALASGTYDIVATATDSASNIGNDNTINELTVDPNPNTNLFDTLSPTLTNGTTTAIIADTGKQASDTQTASSDSSTPQNEASGEGEVLDESIESITTSPQVLIGAPKNTTTNPLQSNAVNQTVELSASVESRVTRSIFTLSEAFDSEDFYQPVERTELRTLNSLPKQFDGTTIDALSRIQAIDSALLSQQGALWSQLDTQRDHMESQINGDLIIVGAAGAAASGFTVGFIAWAFRAGFLASGLLAQLPAWKAMDPTLIMQGFEGFTATSGEDQNNETLEEMMDRQGQTFQTN